MEEASKYYRERAARVGLPASYEAEQLHDRVFSDALGTQNGTEALATADAAVRRRWPTS